MRNRIEKKIQKIRYYVSLLEEYKSDCKERFLQDPMYEGALLHYLYLVTDGCVALSQMLLKYKGKDLSQSYYGSIDNLGEYGLIPKEFSYKFATIASFRNFLAHDYEKIDYLVICEDVLKRLDEVKTYLKYIEKQL